jgi:hypothetical protein
MSKRALAVPVRKGGPNTADMLARIEHLEERLSTFETACPPEFRKLAPDTVAKAIDLDGATSFEVLRNYKHGSIRLSAGQVVRADMYNRIMDHVHNGLLLGRVADREGVLEKYRQEAEAKREAAAAARQELRELAALEAAKLAMSMDPDPEPEPEPYAEDKAEEGE